VATLRQKKNSYFIDYRINGRRIRKKVGRSKKIADLALKDLEVKLAKGELGFEKKDSSLQKLLTNFRSYCKTNLAPGTQKRYASITDNFERFLKTNHPYIEKISQFTPKMFEDHKSFRKEEGAQNRTINSEMVVIRMMFRLAVQWGYAEKNPTDGVSKLKIVKNGTPKFLSEEQCKKLLEASDAWLYPIFYTFLNTGMRKSELENLEWSDVDLDRRKIIIRVKEDWAPKTDEREIPINNGLREVLKRQKEQIKSNYVFPDEDGRKIFKNRLRRRFMTLTKKLGFGEITQVHSLRHTFASHLVMKGIDLPTVSKLLGHSDIETTMIYSHLADEHVDKAVEKLSF